MRRVIFLFDPVSSDIIDRFNFLRIFYIVKLYNIKRRQNCIKQKSFLFKTIIINFDVTILSLKTYNSFTIVLKLN